MVVMTIFSLTGCMLTNHVAREPLAQEPILIRSATPPELAYETALNELGSELGSLVSVESVGSDASGSVIDDLRKGVIDIGIVEISSLRKLSPRFAIYNLAFMFPSIDSLEWFAYEDGEDDNQDLAKYGLGVLDVRPWYGGSFILAGNQPARSPRDFNGGRLAVQGEDTTVKEFASTGANVSTLSASESSSALKRGAIDAAEMQWDELNDIGSSVLYVANTEHRYTGYLVVYNQARLKKISSISYEHLEKAFQTARWRVSSLVLASERKALNRLVEENQLTILEVDNQLRQEWRQAMAVAQASEIRKIGQQRVQRASMDRLLMMGAVPERVDALTWNAWFQSGANQVAATLSTGHHYQFKLDIGRISYPGALSSDVSREIVRELQQDPDRKDITLLVRPVLMGGVLRPLEGSDFGAKPLKIHLNRLTDTSRDEEWLAEFNAGNVTFEDLAIEMTVASSLSWDLITREAGCARIALSVWDAVGLKPLDYLIVDMPVNSPGQAEPHCNKRLKGGELVAGLEGLLNITGGGKSSDRPADSALHLFDTKSSGDAESSTVAVYVDRSEFEAAVTAGRKPVLYAWELGTKLSDYLGQPGKLPYAINRARRTFGEATYPYGDVVRQLGGVLFSGHTNEDRATGQAARLAMQQMAARVDSPVILARYFGEAGEMHYLPLALLAAESDSRVLSRRITVVQPLSSTLQAEAGMCFDAWNFAIPKKLDGVTAEEEELLKSEDWRFYDDKATWHEDNLSLLRFLTGFKYTEVAPRGEGLVLLAHHSDGAVSFSSSALPDRILDSEVNRHFGRGSIAVLAACSTTGVSSSSRAFMKKLSYMGIEAFVVSPFQVDAIFGTHLAVNFAVVAAEARGKGETPRLVDMYNQAVKRTIDKFKDHPGYADMALEFQIVGDYELSMCK